MLSAPAERMPRFERGRRKLPEHHVVVPRRQGPTESGRYRLIITIPSRDLREAITIREMARQTPAKVPAEIDTRVSRYSSTWWLQPRSEQETAAPWRVQV